MARNFIDTNIFVYADANDEPVKQEKSIALIKQNLLEKSGIISTQVLQEYTNVALKKLKLSKETIVSRIELYSNFEIVTISKELIVNAISIQENRKINFFDALIIEAAISAGSDVLLSEDFQNGAKFENLLVVNPFQG